MERKDEQGKSNASTAQKQDVVTQKRIADRIAGKPEPAPTSRAEALEQAAYRPGATYDEQEMAERSKLDSNNSPREGSWYGTGEPELTDELTGETRDPSALEEGLQAIATKEGSGERTRYASDKAAEKLRRPPRAEDAADH